VHKSLDRVVNVDSRETFNNYSRLQNSQLKEGFKVNKSYNNLIKKKSTKFQSGFIDLVNLPREEDEEKVRKSIIDLQIQRRLEKLRNLCKVKDEKWKQRYYTKQGRLQQQDNAYLNFLSEQLENVDSFNFKGSKISSYKEFVRKGGLRKNL